MQTVLDLDLDFFVWPVAHWRTGRGRLPARECYHLATETELRNFLEQRCHLTRNSKIPGREFTEHRHAFRVWRSWLEECKLSAPFAVVHVDAHADLGCGSSWQYLETKLLALPVEERTRPRFTKNGLNSGNYLLFAIANRWIHRLTYVYPANPEPYPSQLMGCSFEPIHEIAKELRRSQLDDDEQPPVSDLPAECFRNRDWKTMLVELRHYSLQQYRLNASLRVLPEPTQAEPAVPLVCLAADKFESYDFTHMVVAQSPQYTPKSATVCFRSFDSISNLRKTCGITITEAILKTRPADADRIRGARPRHP